jgi:hypothetical protein
MGPLLCHYEHNKALAQRPTKEWRIVGDRALASVKNRSNNQIVYLYLNFAHFILQLVSYLAYTYFLTVRCKNISPPGSVAA